MCGAMKNAFFYARVQSDHQQPACRIANLLQCGSSEPLMRAIRQELRVALDDYVDRGVVIPTKGQDAEFHKWVTEIILMSG